MTNPNDAVGTNAAYGTRTSVNAFNDFAQLVNGRGILSGWAVSPKSGMTLNVGGIAGTRDVAVAEDNLGNRTTINNRSNSPIEVELEAASASANRYDAIVVYVNNPAQADDTTPDAPSVCGIIAVQGGTTGVSEQQIRAAISADGGTGSVAYYAVLATIFIGAGTSAITSANITQEHIAISASDIADGEITAEMIDWNSVANGVFKPSAEFTSNATFTDRFSKTLPAGKYIITAAVDFANRNTGASGECKLRVRYGNSFTSQAQNYLTNLNYSGILVAMAYEITLTTDTVVAVQTAVNWPDRGTYTSSPFGSYCTYQRIG